jgi:hypothetical protein
MHFRFYLTACVLMQYEFKVLITLCSRQQILYLAHLELIGSSSPYESNRASPTRGRRPLLFKRDLMGLSLSLSLSHLEVFISDNMLVESSIVSYNIQMLIVFNTV